MISDKKSFTMRIEPDNYVKLNALAKRNKRSMAKELEYIIELYFEGYESQYGQITPRSGTTFLSSTANNERRLRL